MKYCLQCGSANENEASSCAECDFIGFSKPSASFSASEMTDRIAALEAQLAEAREVIKSGQVLVLKMFEVYDEPQYRAAFSLLRDHQGKYSGKTWTKEQDDFTYRAAEFLKKLEASA